MMKTLPQLILLLAIAVGFGCVVMFLAPSRTPAMPVTEGGLNLLPSPDRVEPKRAESAPASGQPRTSDGEESRSERDLIAQLQAAADKALDQSLKIPSLAEIPQSTPGTQPRETNAGTPQTSTHSKASDRLKRLGELCDSLPPEAAAKIFIQMVRDDLTDSVVKLLTLMSDRRAAAVVLEISRTNLELATELTELVLQKRAQPQVSPGEPVKSDQSTSPPAAPALP